MGTMPEEKTEAKIRNRRVHMANERTFLAWIRTGIAVMAFGFVVERFSLFVKQVGYSLGKEVPEPPSGTSSAIGILLVGLGVVMGVLAFFRYKAVERQIDEDAYRPSALLNTMLALAIIAVGVFLILYLIHSR